MRDERIQCLSERIRGLASRPRALTGEPSERVDRLATGWGSIDERLGGGIPFAGLHEWWGECTDVHSVLVQLAWRTVLHEDAARPGRDRHVAWIGRAAWPDAGHLVRGLRSPVTGLFGAPRIRSWPDARLHERSIMVDVPAHDDGARLWAIEQAVRCPGICAVVADGRGLPMPATRRLQLAAHGVLLCSMRGPERRAGERRSAASACATRWWVEPSAGVRHVPWLRAMHALAGRIPPEPAWTVRLERAKATGVDAGACPQAVATEWWRTDGTPEPPPRVRRARARRAARVARLGGARAA
jgi:hypothetical protein